jgi:hypothetical protein
VAHAVRWRLGRHRKDRPARGQVLRDRRRPSSQALSPSRIHSAPPVLDSDAGLGRRRSARESQLRGAGAAEGRGRARPRGAGDGAHHERRQQPQAAERSAGERAAARADPRRAQTAARTARGRRTPPADRVRERRDATGGRSCFTRAGDGDPSRARRRALPTRQATAHREPRARRARRRARDGIGVRRNARARRIGAGAHSWACRRPDGCTSARGCAGGSGHHRTDLRARAGTHAFTPRSRIADSLGCRPERSRPREAAARIRGGAARTVGRVARRRRAAVAQLQPAARQSIPASGPTDCWSFGRRYHESSRRTTPIASSTIAPPSCDSLRRLASSP